MPSSRHKSPTFVSRLPIAAVASRSLAGVILGLRPPLRPRARAEARPARVRSEIRSHPAVSYLASLVLTSDHERRLLPSCKPQQLEDGSDEPASINRLSLCWPMRRGGT